MAGVGHVGVDLDKIRLWMCASRYSTYTAVSAVCTPSLLRGLVDLDVLDDQVGGVEALGVGVGLSVLEQTEEELGALDGPAGLGDTESLACDIHVRPIQLPNTTPDASTLANIQSRRNAVLPSLAHRPDENFAALTLRSAAGAASVPPHGNGLLVLEHIVEEGKGTLKTPSVDSLGGLAGVLERGAEVAAASPGGLCVVDRGGCVANLHCN